MDAQWDRSVAELLNELCATQDEFIQVLTQKRDLLVAADTAGMHALQDREQGLIDRLRSCHQQRGDLLEQAGAEGLPHDSIRSLASTLPPAERQHIERQVAEATSRGRLLQHHSLTNWVLAQRTLIHLAQLLEIIATGGRPRPTYGKTESADAHGALVDQAA